MCVCLFGYVCVRACERARGRAGLTAIIFLCFNPFVLVCVCVFVCVCVCVFVCVCLCVILCVSVCFM